MTIKHKLTAIIMLISVTSLILGLVAFIVWEYFDLKKDMVTKLSTHAAIIADNAKAAVQFENAEDAGSVLRALQAEPSVVHARICTKDGNDLASYNIHSNDKSIHLISITGGDYTFTHNSLNLKKDIILDKEKIGTIYIESNLDDLNNGITRTAGIGALIALIVIIVAYFLSAKLQKIISSPILNLASVANMVSENKDYSTRAIKHANDEIGQLIDAFNEMLVEIQQRDGELLNVNERLEFRVKEKTADLIIANKQLEQLNMELKATVSKLTSANKELSDFAHAVTP
jgi:methyl-accepting chemotaxis protein